MTSSIVLLLPGWQNSGASHWQSRWEALYGYQRVEQHDWDRPLRGDWITRLEDVVSSQSEGTEVTLVAHSMACVLVAAWAPLSRVTHRVKGALLVATSDMESNNMRNLLPSWSPVVEKPLPFPAVLVTSQNDPYCSFPRACELASAWGARRVDLGRLGHINGESGLGDWQEGHELLLNLRR